MIQVDNHWRNYRPGNEVMIRIIVIMILTLIYFNGYAEYRGVVFIDENENGVFDAGEKGLAGVAVSDGLHVTLTASDGSFSLPGFENERFIFITTPSGYKNKAAHYISIRDKGEGYDFGLISYPDRVNEDGSHQFIHIADSEISQIEGNERWTSMIRDYANNGKAAFVMHTGDICYEKGLKSHIQLMNTKKMGTQMYYCIGNHDLVEGEYGEQLFESLYGPVYYSFDVGNTHYIVTPMENGDYKPSYTKEQVYHWLKNDLANISNDKSIVVFNHDLLTHGDDFYYGTNEEDRINLNDHNLKAWVYGHWHINQMKNQGGVYTICTSPPNMGGIDHSTSVFRVIHVEADGAISSELRYNNIDETISISSISNNQSPVLPSGEIPLSVNAYKTTSNIIKISYEVYADGKVISEGFLNQNTDWNWTKNISVPSGYKGTELIVQVVASTNSGKRLFDQRAFHYESYNSGKLTFGEDWNNLLKNARHTGNTGGDENYSLSLQWVQNIKANIFMSSPLIHRGNIYVASVDENNKGEAKLMGLDGQSGKVLWTYKTRESIKNSIAAEDNLIFAQDTDGFVYAVDAKDGNLLWEKKMEVQSLPAITEGLVVHKGIVYAGSGKGFCALKAKTGSAIWCNQDWNQNQGATSTITVDEKVAIHGTQWGSLYANDAETGKILWRNNQNGLSNRGSTPVLHDNILYVISDRSIFLIDSKQGNIIYRKKLPFNVDVTSTPLVTESKIVFGTVDQGIVALDKETFEEEWNYKTGEALTYTSPYVGYPASMVETSPVSWGNKIFVGASDGILYGLDADDGSLKWKQKFGAPILSTVAVSGNVLVATDLSGNVYAFRGVEK